MVQTDGGKAKQSMTRKTGWDLKFHSNFSYIMYLMEGKTANLEAEQIDGVGRI